MSEVSGKPSGCKCRGCLTSGTKRASRQQNAPWDAELRDKQWAALSAGKAEGSGLHWSADYHGDCESPIRRTVTSVGPLYRSIAYNVRCRKCRPCKNAKRAYWALAASHVTKVTMTEGRRTWFGTLTATPEAHEAMLKAAIVRTGPDVAWEDAGCEARFLALRREFLIEVQKYWKRLRKEGAEFAYVFVVERHKSGWPHGHFLLHEKGDPIRKRTLQAQWRLGFSNVSIVGGKSKHAAAPERAAWYVAKYLSKSECNGSRVVSSAGYRPERSMDRGFTKPPKGRASKAGVEQSTPHESGGALTSKADPESANAAWSASDAQLVRDETHGKEDV